jgi:hypothetical protein
MFPIISKSTYLAGLQCPKRLWIRYNDPGLMPEVDDHTQALFDQGREVGSLAKELFPGGIEVAGPHTDFPALVEKTKELLPLGRPLFEAAFLHESAFVRVDILVPMPEGTWDLVEVKSSGEVKDVYVDDIAFQYYVCSGAGILIRKCFVMHINKSYVRSGPIESLKLFTREDITREVKERAASIAGNIAAMQTTITAPEVPDRPIGPHCSEPYECPLIGHCWSFVPEDSVFSLCRLNGRKAFDLYEQGFLSVLDLPEDYETTERREIQIRAVRTGEIQVDHEKVRGFLDGLRYPLYFLDFETIYPAVPRYDGTKPFQQIPFQFSLHVVRTPGAEPEQYGFLADGPADPRPELLRQLRLLLGTEGSVVVYNATFERECLMDCAGAFPDYGGWCDAIVARLSDLCRLFSDFSWYHPGQHGSASMKTVLPLLTGLSYDNLPIADGTAASNAFMRMTFGEIAEEERRRSPGDLERYCGLDTGGMVAMVEGLRGIHNA